MAHSLPYPNITNAVVSDAFQMAANLNELLSGINTWSGGVISVSLGGTGLSSYTIGDTLYASATTTLSKLGIGSANQVYGVNAAGTAPAWKPVTISSAGAVGSITDLTLSGFIYGKNSKGLVENETGSFRNVINFDTSVGNIALGGNTATFTTITQDIGSGGTFSRGINGTYYETLTAALYRNQAASVRLDSLSSAGTRIVTATSTGVLGIMSSTFPSASALGDMIYASAANVWSALSGNTTANIQVLTQTGTGAVSAAPVWNATTGTGNVMFSASPTTTGTLTGAAANFSGDITVGTTKFTVAAATGNTLINGTLGVSESSVRTGYKLDVGGSIYTASSGAAWDAAGTDTGQDGIFVRNINASAGINTVIAGIGFGKIDGSSSRRAAAIASIQTTADADQVGLVFYVSASTASSQTMVEALRISHNSTALFAGAVTSTGVFTASTTSTLTGIATFDGGITMGDAKNIVVNSTTGTIIATATTQKLGFYNATPIVQRSGAAQAAVATTAATNVAPYGYTTAAQADAIITLLNELRAWAVAQGFIKGSA